MDLLNKNNNDKNEHYYSNYVTGIILCALDRINTLNPHDNPMN